MRAKWSGGAYGSFAWIGAVANWMGRGRRLGGFAAFDGADGNLRLGLFFAFALCALCALFVPVAAALLAFGFGETPATSFAVQALLLLVKGLRRRVHQAIDLIHRLALSGLLCGYQRIRNFGQPLRCLRQFTLSRGFSLKLSTTECSPLVMAASNASFVLREYP